MSKEKFTHIAEFGKALAMNTQMDSSLEMIADKSKELLNAERCSIFMVDNEAQMLWTKHSDGIGRIAISLDSGIAGETFQKQMYQLVNDPYKDKRFLAGIDKQSGFVTKNIITMPIISSMRNVIGVIQLLNKNEGDFTSDDVHVLTFFANYVSGSLELSLMLSDN